MSYWTENWGAANPSNESSADLRDSELDFARFDRVALLSRKLGKIPHIATFLGAREIVGWPTFGAGMPGKKPDAVTGWGHKSNTNRARKLALQHSIPYLAVEDGFLRSLGLGGTGAPPLSLIVDDLGVYYDSTRPSRLEEMLNADGPFDPGLLARAETALGLMHDNRLSKYNSAPDVGRDLLPPTTRRRVLLVDQTLDDMSVLLGQGSAAAFQHMLESAQDENPEAELVIKLHPETVAGSKRGYLSEMDLPKGARVIDTEVNPAGLLERCDHVYTVSSQLGMEALLAGKPVTCHGLPFYAGWGASQDRLGCVRRQRTRSPLEIFAAAWIRYARYVDPVIGEPCGIERAIDLLTEAQHLNDANRGTTICLGMQRWKRKHLRPFLASTGGRTIFARSCGQALRRGARPGDRVLVWGANEPPGLAPLVSQLAAPLGRVEDGFLRSIGLGSDFVQPCSVTVDWQGAYFDPTAPSDLETVLSTAEFDMDILVRAAALRKRIVGAQLSKYNVGNTQPVLPESAAGRKVVLVPGQVETDASVHRGGGEIRSNLALVRAVRQALPDAFIAWKPHPDVVAGNRRGGSNQREISVLCDTIWTGAHIDDCLALVDEVHVLTSLTGFEALLRGKHVVAYGGPFYAGWGLTEDRIKFPRRNRELSIDQLVAAALILFPRYYDWPSGTICDVESIVERIASQTAGTPAPADVSPMRRLDQVTRRIARYLAGMTNA